MKAFVRNLGLTSLVLGALLLSNCGLFNTCEIRAITYDKTLVSSGSLLPDYSHVLKAQVVNTGPAGNFKVEGELKGPRGNTIKQALVHLNTNESKTVELIFTDPSLTEDETTYQHFCTCTPAG